MNINRVKALNTTLIEGSEAYSMLLDFTSSITLLKNLLNPDRLHAVNLPKNSEGKIEVNITSPHILENMDYFRQAAITFTKTGKYTETFPSKDSTSPYRRFWDEEKRRCKFGYIRKTDGEWITGYHYFYLNYCPILKTEVIGNRNKSGSIRAERVEGFSDIWDGDYLFYHYVEQAETNGEYAAVLKARGKGYSFKAASMLIRNYELFAKSKSFAFAAESEYLDSDGLLNKAWAYLDFVSKHVGFSKTLRLKDTMMQKTAGYKKMGDPVEYGFLSSIIGVTMKNNPGKSRGKRGKLIVWEEGGIFPNLLKSWRIAQKSLEDGNRIFGLMLALGTGGEKGANFIGLEALFYKSVAYRVKTLSNVFDKNTSKQFCAFFMPDYLNRADCYDKNGNSDTIKALEEIIKGRIKLKYAGVDPDDLAQNIAEEAITPQEAIMRTEGTIFPANELKNYLSEIAPKQDVFTAKHYIGDLFFENHNKVAFKPDFSKVPLREYPVRKASTEGAIEIFTRPIEINGIVQSGRYIGGADTVDDEYGTSLFSIFIMDLFTDTIVAEWTGRYRTADANFKIALMLAIYYNAEINYENKLKGMFSYFDRRNALNYLCDTPLILQDMDYVSTKERYGNKKKGTPPTLTINKWGRRLQADWMLLKNPTYDNELNYRHIKSLGYIRECIAWNMLGNFDRVSAGIMLFILREDRLKAIDNNKCELDITEDYNNDPFFSDNLIDCVEEFDTF